MGLCTRGVWLRVQGECRVCMRVWGRCVQEACRVGVYEGSVGWV